MVTDLLMFFVCRVLVVRMTLDIMFFYGHTYVKLIINYFKLPPCDTF